MIQFLALVRRDLLIFFGNRKAMMVSIVVPIVLASFFGYLFGGHGGNAETSKVSLLAIDQDGSDISRGLIAQLSTEKTLSIRSENLETARELVRKGKATAALVIPKDFGRDAGQALFGGSAKPEIEVLYDPSHNVEVSMVKGLLSGAVMQTVSKEMFSGPRGREMVNETIARLNDDSRMPAEDRRVLRNLLGGVRDWNERLQSPQNQASQQRLSGGLAMPYSTKEEAITSGRNVDYNGYAHSFGGMGVQFILFMGLDVGIALLTLRQTGLWQRLRAAPLSKTMLLGSRTLSAALIAGLILFVLFTFARLVFGVHVQGSMLGFIGVCAAFSLMTAAFGLMIAALGETVDTTRGYSIMATLFMVMLGGAWVPTFVFPAWLQKVALFVPTRWAIEGMDGMTWRGLGLSSALAPIGVLLLFTFLFGMIAVLRFRWQID